MRTIIKLDSDYWGEIIASLTRNKTRTFLTAFGIFWGVFMLVFLMGGGKGLESMLRTTFAGFATNSGFMAAEPTGEAYKGFKKGRHWAINVTDVPRIRSCVPEVDIVSPVLGQWGSTATYEGHKSGVSVMGQYPEEDFIETPKIQAGRTITHADVKTHRKVCVIGSRVAEELFNGQADGALGKFISIDGIYYQVVGVSGKSANSLSIIGDAGSKVCIPYTTMQSTYNRGNTVDILGFTARNGYKISDVQKKVEAVLKRAHSISPTDTHAVMAINLEAMFSLVDTLFLGVSILVWMIGLSTLLAGAIGVSNIMVITVKERTTEIGIRRAIGATPKDILSMVMNESVMLTLVAGMSGVVLAVLALQTLETVVQADTPDVEFQISFGLAATATTMLALLGVAAGLAPTIRAMAIKPVDAMREE